MSWYGKLTFGSLGLFLGGPLGAVIGAALGHHMVDRRMDMGAATGGLKQVEKTRAAFFASVFSILGRIAEADGAITEDEVAVVDNFIASLNISSDEREFAREVFNEARHSHYSIDDFASQFYSINRNNREIVSSFMDVLFQVAAADGKLHPAEEESLNRVRRIFRISDHQFQELRAHYFDEADKYYRILGCTPESSDREIKKNYRKLVKDFHPDTIVSKGLPEEFIQFATRRFEEIQEAYEKIREKRGF
ncbi:MAG: DnaJ domain-containing protein [Candidatus Latescibacteria bacterium]|nr:DnaJ domain-containing protein [bacterium]MBD3423747.1 DnaJ domain-containing protein [Candidatus Latescibacterota bacterium]